MSQMVNTKQSVSSDNPIKAGLGYTLGNILVKGITFLSIPLFSRLMSTEQFGIYNVFISYEAILYVLIGLAIHCSIQSANLKFNNEINRYVSSVSLIYIFNTVLALLIVAVFGSKLSLLFHFDKSILVCLVLYSFGTSIITLFNNVISLKYQYRKYIIVAFINTIGNIILSLVLMLSVFSYERDLGRIIGATVTIICLSVCIVINFFSKSRPIVSKRYWSYALRYSLPLVPHGIAQVLLAQFDRIMIRHLVSDSAAGIYSLAANLRLLLTVITDSIITAWRTWFFKAIQHYDSNYIQKRACQLIELYFALTILIMALSPEAILILGGKKYQAANYVTIPMLLDAFILFIYSIIVQSEYYKEKTNYIMIGTMIASILNIVLNYIFIIKYGFVAAAYTTLFSYFVYLLLHLLISYRLMNYAIVPFRNLFSFFICSIGIGAFMTVFSDSLPLRLLIATISIIIIAIHLFQDESIRRSVVGKIRY